MWNTEPHLLFKIANRRVQPFRTLGLRNRCLSMEIANATVVSEIDVLGKAPAEPTAECKLPRSSLSPTFSDLSVRELNAPSRSRPHGRSCSPAGIDCDWVSCIISECRRRLFRRYLVIV